MLFLAAFFVTGLSSILCDFSSRTHRIRLSPLCLESDFHRVIHFPPTNLRLSTVFILKNFLLLILASALLIALFVLTNKLLRLLSTVDYRCPTIELRQHLVTVFIVSSYIFRISSWHALLPNNIPLSVNYYILFKWWLIPSLHSDRFLEGKFFILILNFKTLTKTLGCFPLDYEDSPSQSHFQKISLVQYS